MPKRSRSLSSVSSSRPSKKRRMSGVSKSRSRRRARALNKELKGMDTPIDQATNVLDTTSTNGDAYCLNLVQAGTGSWNRVGKKIYPQSLRLKGVATCVIDNQGTTGSLLSNTVRMVVVWDKQPSGNTIPAFSNVFGRTEQDGSESSAILDSLKYDNTDRFMVLKDIVITANPQANDSTAGGTINAVYYGFDFDEYIDLSKKRLETVFSGQSSPMTMADMSSGAIYIYYRATVDDTTTHWVVLPESFARLRYYD